MSINIRLRHKIKVNRRLYTRGLPRLLEEMSTKSQKALQNIAANFIQELGFTFNTAKSGRLYTMPDGTTHQASAPEESPAQYTGNLLDKVIATPNTESGPIHSFVIVSNAFYSKELEFGSYRIAARPFMRPTLLKRTKPYMWKYFRNKVNLAKGKKIEDWYVSSNSAGETVKTTLSGKGL